MQTFFMSCSDAVCAADMLQHRQRQWYKMHREHDVKKVCINGSSLSQLQPVGFALYLLPFSHSVPTNRSRLSGVQHPSGRPHSYHWITVRLKQESSRAGSAASTPLVSKWICGGLFWGDSSDDSILRKWN